MTRIILIAALALGLSGCANSPFWMAVEQDAAAVIAKIKAGAPVAIAAVDNVANTICTNGPSVLDQGAAELQSLMPNPTPKQAKWLGILETSVSVFEQSCAAYSANTTLTGKAAIALKVWNAYQAGKNALAQAKAS